MVYQLIIREKEQRKLLKVGLIRKQNMKLENYHPKEM